MRTVCLSFILSALVPILSNAQTTWIEEGKGSSISIEAYRPSIPRDSFFNEILPSYTPLTGSIFLTGKYSLNKNFTLVADIPFAGGNYDDTAYAGEGQFIIGNPYIGAEYYLSDSPLMFELGLRIPVVGEDNVTSRLAGTYSDLDRGEAFGHTIVPVIAAVNYETINESNILLRGRAGVNLWFNSHAAGLETQPLLSVDYSLQAGYLHRYVHVIATLSARYGTDTGPRYPIKETELQYGLSLNFPLKKISPGIVLKVPGNPFTGGFINYVVGLNCTYLFK